MRGYFSNYKQIAAPINPFNTDWTLHLLYWDDLSCL